MTEKDDYWTSFWTQHGQSTVGANQQLQVLRTLNKEPIEAGKWARTLEHIISTMDLQPTHRVLDLCGGNGLIAQQMAKVSSEVVVVDISPNLLDHLPADANNVVAKQGDMREVDFEHGSFERIICYAALQYLNFAETTRLFRKLFNWLRPGGLLFVGDIPDSQRIWSFFDSPERRAAYFQHLQAGSQIVGTWFSRDWLQYLAEVAGFSHSETMDQPDEQIYSWFRFDMKCRK